MIYKNIAKIKICNHLQNHLFIFFSFHNNAKYAKKIIYEMGMYKSVERKFLHKKNKDVFRTFFKKLEMKKT
jgi:hypothetical protein